MSLKGIKNRESGKWKRLGIFLILLLVFGLLLNSVSKVYKKKQEAEKILVRMEEQATELKQRNQFLKESLEKLATEEGVEFEIRKKLNVAEVGESVAIIVEEEPIASTSNPQISSWQKFKNFFTELFE
ncbi:MAG: hypothetical protein AAB350_00045 [Patescibacteria group bacterium]